MKKIYFAGQDNFGNRGCEALIRSNVKLIREQFPDVEFLVPSSDIKSDSAQWPKAAALGVAFISSEPIPSKIRWWSRARRVWKGLDATRPNFKLTAKTEHAIRQSDALIMTGGDIISLDYGLESLYYWAGICEAGMKANKPTVLWAASIGPFGASPKVEALMREYLSRFSLITVRETATLAYLDKIGIKGAHYVADPAFCLDAETAPVGDLTFFGNQSVLGFNVSPLIRKFRQDDASKKSLDLEVVKFLVQVLQTTEFGILLIPHVDPLNGAEENSDSTYMAGLLALLNTMHPGLNDRVKLLRRGLNAGQLKDVIRHCKCFMGARTHATVAALSQGVPTTSIAYSVKAKGINHDIFGHNRYVLETPEVSASTLYQHFDLLASEHLEIMSHLKTKVPALQGMARASAGHLADLLKGT